MSLNVNSALRRAKKLEGIGDYAGALTLYRQILASYPGNRQAQRGLQAAQAANTTRGVAAPDFEQGIRHAIALYNAGQLNESLDLTQRLAAQAPEDPLLQNLIGAVSTDLKRYEQAIVAFSKAVKLKPDYLEAHQNAAELYSRLRRHEEAVLAYSSVLQIDPTSPEAIVNLLYEQANICHWDNIGQWLDKLRALDIRGRPIHPGRLLPLVDDPVWHHRVAENFCTVKFPPNSSDNSLIAHPREKLRVGFFSPDFRFHAVSFLTCRFFELMDKERFELYAYSFSATDDEMSERIRAAMDKFQDVSAENDADVVAICRADELDVAIDLAGHTDAARTGIFSYRVAPVQASYLGYPGTLGAPFIDYLLCDEVVVPESERENFSEEVVYLPNTYVVNDNTRVVDLGGMSREDYGLPGEGFVFCCFNGSQKISPVEFSVWMRLLQEVEDSVLWLLASNELAVKNLRKEARARGVDPDRLVFADRILDQSLHLSRYQLADLFLDTFIYNAHTTGSDALWAGLPVLTRKGRSFASRVGASMLEAIGLEVLVTETAEEYESLALALARDPDRLRVIRATLARNRLASPLFDTEAFTRNFESALQQVYLRACEGR